LFVISAELNIVIEHKTSEDKKYDEAKNCSYQPSEPSSFSPRTSHTLCKFQKTNLEFEI